MPERRPKPKLPRSVIILNVVMILLILLVCGLTFSLAFSAIKKETPATTVPTTRSTMEALNVSGAEQSEEESEEARPHTPPVSMTKRTTEPTEPPTPPETTPEPTVESQHADNPTNESSAPSTSWSQEFFADDLFIGDSISTGLYLYGKLEMKNVAAGIGYTPYKAYSEAIDLYDGTSATALEYAQKMQPKRIFIMLGSNGMGSTTDIEGMKSTYKTLLEKLTSSCSDSEVYCISVSPVTADSTSAASAGITNEMISDFNASVKAMCGDMGLRYLDLYSLLIDENGYFNTDYAEVDGLHFLGTTYDVMLSFIQSEIGG
ncbi:MAG: hypothetical protein K2O14_12980 [Oscillospiraceae bacterium]|nr:hypothetical protein [Oscillospiraceae bacterium]